MDPRAELLRIIEEQGGVSDHAAPSPTVTLEAFFEGNEDEASIGGNLVRHPGINTFYKVLREIRSRDDVQDVLVRIYGIEDGSLPYSDTVFVLTSAPLAEIARLSAPLDPSHVYEDGDPEWGEVWERDKHPVAPSCQPAMRAVYIWWD